MNRTCAAVLQDAESRLVRTVGNALASIGARVGDRVLCVHGRSIVSGVVINGTTIRLLSPFRRAVGESAACTVRWLAPGIERSEGARP
jgi:hypothetical protein